VDGRVAAEDFLDDGGEERSCKGVVVERFETSLAIRVVLDLLIVQ
jgi:hypothetical protein